jgi:hypothetical protein
MEFGKPYSFSSIINNVLLEPRMLEGLLSRQPLLRVVDEDLLQQI